MLLLDNFTVALFNKLNELAERYGVKPYEFVATFHDAKENAPPSLDFEVGPKDQQKHTAFEKMLDSIGVDADGRLSGECDSIYKAIESAILIAPKPRHLG